MTTAGTIDRDIRWMIRKDMPWVVATGRASFEFAWTEDDFLRHLRRRDCIGMIADRADRPAGYVVYELHRTRLHILSLAVAPADRRAGVATRLVAKLATKLLPHRRGAITAAVGERNTAAQLFLRTAGFKATRVLWNYYDDSGEDAYHMEYRPDQSPAVRRVPW